MEGVVAGVDVGLGSKKLPLLSLDQLANCWSYIAPAV